MKKLMVAAFAVAFAAVAQAAYFDWSVTITELVSGNPADLSAKGMNAFVYDATTWGVLSATEITGLDSFTGYADTSTFSKSTQGSGTGQRYKFTASGKEVATDLATGPTQFYLVLADENGYYATAFGNDMTTNPSQVYADTKAPGTAAGLTLGTGAPVITANDFTKYDGVPEPTSGLLLLLGVAGLALKRKRA